MQNASYEVIFQPDIRRATQIVREPIVTEALLEQLLPGSSLRESIKQQWGPRSIHVQLDRPSHEQALEDIARAAAQLGFSIGIAVVNEWVDDAGERAARWLLGDGALDVADIDPVDAVLVYLVGTGVRFVVGREEQKLKARSAANWLYFGGWQLTPLELAKQTALV